MAFYDSGIEWDSGARWDEGGVEPPDQNGRNKKMKYVKIGLTNRTNASTISKGTLLITELTGNADFPDADVAGLQAAVTTAEASRDARIAGEMEQAARVTVENDNADTLYGVIAATASHVQDVSGGDEMKILSTGFEVRNDPAPIGELPAPDNFLAVTGDMAGEVKLNWDVVKGTSVYQIEHRDDADGSVWQGDNPAVKSKTTVTGLTPGAAYRFRVAALGTAGQGPWSDESMNRAG